MRPEVARKVTDAAERVMESIESSYLRVLWDLPPQTEDRSKVEEEEFTRRVMSANAWEYRKEPIGEPGEGMTSDFFLRINLPVCPDCGREDLKVTETEHIQTGTVIGGLICPGCLSEHSVQVDWSPHYTGPRKRGGR